MRFPGPKLETFCMRMGLRVGLIVRAVHFLLCTEGKRRKKVYQDEAMVVLEAVSEGNFEDDKL